MNEKESSFEHELPGEQKEEVMDMYDEFGREINPAQNEQTEPNTQTTQTTQTTQFTMPTQPTGYTQSSPYSQAQYAQYRQSQAAQQAGAQQAGAQQHQGGPGYASPVTPPVYTAKQPKPKKEKGKSGFWGKALAAIGCGVLFGLVAGTIMYAVNFVGEKYFPTRKAEISAEESPRVPSKPSIEQTQPIYSEAPALTSSSQATVMDASAVAEDCMPSIVAITNKSIQYYQSFWGLPGQYEAQASGSGIIVGENENELLIVTNSHVIEDSTELTVQFQDGESCDAQIKGSKNAQDIAVIAVKLSDLPESTKKSIKIATLGDSDSVKVGEPAIAIGNSLGYGQTVTAGVISALNRDFTVDNNTKQVIQTDAAINPGNSGGALLNIRGEVIGINEAKYASTSVEGVAYAIPISTAKPIIDDLATKTTRAEVKESEQGFLGVTGVDVTEDVSQMYGLPSGVYIAQVIENSAAEKAGLGKGDIITEFDGESVSTMEELKNAVSHYAAGTEVELRVQCTSDDGYEEKVIKVTLGKKED